MLVREVMRKPVAVRAEETLQAATARLKQENVGALPVVEGDQLVGMITDRDILLRGGGEGRSSARTKARQAMSIAPLVCHDGDALDHALAVMRSNHVQRLPVLDQNEKLVGVLSVNDFSAPLSDPTAIEVVFYKQLPDSTGHVHNVELMQGCGCPLLLQIGSRASGDLGVRKSAEGALGSRRRRLRRPGA